MASFFTNIMRGFVNTCTKPFQSPYRAFGISWMQEKALKHDPRQTETSFLFKGKYRIHYLDRLAFLLSVREIFTEKVYDFKSLSDRPRIIDCGGHIGMSALFFITNYPGCRLTIFEPDFKNHELLQKNISGWGANEIEAIQAAVWTENGQVVFQSNHDMSSSIALSNQNTPEQRSVRSIRLSDWLSEPIDFLKIDIEGAEYDVLLDCKEKLKNVRNLFVEYHGNLDESKKLTELLLLFNETGFNHYVTEAGHIHTSVFKQRDRRGYKFDQQLNIFCFRD
jgi:FkbM family methyltransferase